MTTPSQLQADQSVIAQHEFREVLDRIVREGIDYRAILAGAGAAIAGSIVDCTDAQSVPRWFAIQAKLAADFLTRKD